MSDRNDLIDAGMLALADWTIVGPPMEKYIDFDAIADFYRTIVVPETPGRKYRHMYRGIVVDVKTLSLNVSSIVESLLDGTLEIRNPLGTGHESWSTRKSIAESFAFDRTSYNRAGEAGFLVRRPWSERDTICDMDRVREWLESKDRSMPGDVLGLHEILHRSTSCCDMRDVARLDVVSRSRNDHVRAVNAFSDRGWKVVRRDPVKSWTRPFDRRVRVTRFSIRRPRTVHVSESIK